MPHHRVLFVFACLVWEGQGRRIQSERGEQFVDSYYARDESDVESDADELDMLLLALSRPGSQPRTRQAAIAQRSRSRMYMQETELETELSTRESLKEKTPAQTQIEEIIALQPIVMFEKGACPFCAKAKAAFDEIGVKIATVDLENLNPSVAAEVQDHLETLTGARTVPRVFVNHKFIGGGTAVVELQEKGELLPLVEKAREAHTLDLEGKDYFSDTIDMTNEDWEEKLSPEAFRILRTRGTEYPNSHEYTQFYPTTGYFGCAACDLPLYSASSKFKSSCGWPVFNMCFHSDDLGCHILTRPDGSGALEIACPKCAGHLGHVFFDAFSAENPNGERH